jgi:hypothetical protein
VALVAAIPAAFYVHGLGFYLDDHFFIAVMDTSRQHSVAGMFHVLLEDDSKAWLRPAMYAGFAAMFRLFGTDPLPYHVVVAALVPLSAVLLYILLVRLRAPAFVAVAVPIVFAAAPHFSTDRFWLASWAAPASLVFAIAAILCFLEAVNAHATRPVLVAGGCLAVVTSVLLYEVAIPGLVVAVAVLVVRARRVRSARLPAAAAASATIGSLVYKAVASATLVGSSTYRVGYSDGALHHLGYLISGSIKVNFGTYGMGLPYVVGWIVAHHLTWVAVVPTVLVGVLVYAYLVRRDAPELTDAVGTRWRRVAVCGIAIFVLGYATFLVTGAVYFTSAGIDNRVNIVAAVGVAFLAVALLVGATSRLPPDRRRVALAAGCAIVAATGTLVTGTLADDWVAANTKQQLVLARLDAVLHGRAANATVVLDGVCPEIGPGIVFAAGYDLADALRARRGEFVGIHEAPVATKVMAARPRGLVISTFLFGTLRPHLYPYRPLLVVYDWRRATLVRLANEADARAYLASTPRPSCPDLRSFNWGIHKSRFVPFASGRARQR